MSKKFLNKIISAILVLAICSTAFIGCVVTADETAATYTFHDGEIVSPRDEEGTIQVTITSTTPFGAVDFVVDDYVNNIWRGNYDEEGNAYNEKTSKNYHVNGWLELTNVELVPEKTLMADQTDLGVDVVDLSDIGWSSEYNEDVDDNINSVTVVGDVSSNKRYYTTLTLELTFACQYSDEYRCTLCDWSYSLSEGDEDLKVEANTFPTSFENCPNCDYGDEKGIVDFVKRKFNFADQYNFFTFELASIELSDRGQNIWSATDTFTYDKVSTIPKIHSCTYREGDSYVSIAANGDHYEIQATSCLACNESSEVVQNQIVLDTNTYKYGGNAYSSISLQASLHPDYYNISYNEDGTVNLNVFVDQDFFINGRDGKSGDWEPVGMVVTNEAGEIFTRYAGENTNEGAQAKEDISSVLNNERYTTTDDEGNTTIDYSKVDVIINYYYQTDENGEIVYDDNGEPVIDSSKTTYTGEKAEDANKYGGLRAFSYNNIPASDIGGNLLFTIIGTRNTYPDEVYYGNTYTISVADYCYEVINSTDDTVTENDRALSKALLNYGAAAQQYFSEETIAEENLINYALSDEDKTLDTEFITNFGESKGYTVGELTENDAGACFFNFSAIFRTNPTLKFYFRITNREYWQSKEKVTVEFTFDGTTKTVAASEMQNVATAPTYHAYNYSDISIFDVHEQISFDLQVNGTSVQTGSCSLAGYAKAAYDLASAANATDDTKNLSNLAVSMVNYADVVTAVYGQQ